MRKRRFVVSLSSVFVLALAGAPRGQTRWLEAYREPARRIIDESRASTFAWDRLAELGDTFGSRLSGSENLDAAIKWAADQMRQDGLENVRLDPVKVPHWVRGAESLEIIAPGRHPLAMLGLGNSIGTPPDGIAGRPPRRAQFSGARRLRRPRPRAGSCSSTSRSRPTARPSSIGSDGPSRAAAKGRGRRAGPRRRPAGPAHAAYRIPLVTRTASPQIPAAAVSAEDADRLAADAEPRHTGPPAAADGGQVPSRRRLLQPDRRDPRTRAARTRSSS